MPELVFFRRGQQLLKLNIERGRTVLGRGALCDIALPDPELSPQHVALLYDGERCLLEDLSGKGTVVNGKPMRHGELGDGFTLTLGQWRALYQRSAASTEFENGVGQSTAVQASAPQEEGPPPAQVRIQQGTTEFIHEFTRPVLTVGKAEGNTLVLKDEFISSQHLRVTRRPEGFHVSDLSSTNGTFQGTTRLFEAVVAPHAVLRLGNAQLTFEPLRRAGQEPSVHDILGNDPAMLQLRKRIEQLAPENCAVAVLGESGTGKELVAKALHYGSPRASRKFIPLNCATISRELMESELFGHEKGAFTGADTRRKGAFEEAHGGTLFLDELGELPLDLQAKLLRVLEFGEVRTVGASMPHHVDVRVVVATHRDLRELVRKGQFREDLYYRLCGTSLNLPPLRQRGADIRLLSEHFLRLATPSGQRATLTPAALDKLSRHSWPGNIRELCSVVRNAMLFRKSAPQVQVLDASDMVFEPPLYLEPAASESALYELPEGVTLEQRVEQLRRAIVEHTLRRHGFDKERAAQQLGTGRSTLYKWLKAWGLERGEQEPSD